MKIIFIILSIIIAGCSSPSYIILPETQEDIQRKLLVQQQLELIEEKREKEKPNIIKAYSIPVVPQASRNEKMF